MKICTKCGERKALGEFYRKKNRRTSRCRDCLKADMWARDQKPESKARQKAHCQKPEVKARKKAHDQKPESKARQKAYCQKPEVKARRKARMKDCRQKPEVKAYMKDYQKAYRTQARRAEMLIGTWYFKFLITNMGTSNANAQ